MCILFDLAAAHIFHIPCLYTYQCMLFYVFGKEMIIMPWIALYMLGYIPVYGISWLAMTLYIWGVYATMYLLHTYVAMHPVLYGLLVWLLMNAYIYAVQPDLVISWGCLWTQMVIFANIIVAVVLGHVYRTGGKATA